MSVSRRVRRAAVAAVGAAPLPLKRIVFGAPIRRQDLTLHPDMQAMLTLMRFENPDPAATPISRQRRDLARADRLVGGDQPIGAVTERQIAGAGGPIRMRFYTPRDLRGPSPALVWFHGGGFTLGDLESHDSLCRFLAEQAMVRVVAVDYRLAPEHPFPAAVDDCVEAWTWIARNASGLAIDPDRIAVGGDSAGGNLATVVAQEMVRTGGPSPRFQLLVYPVTDFTSVTQSRREFAEGFFLTDALMDEFDNAYLVRGEDRSDPRISPIKGSLEDLPPAHVVTAGFDPLRDEGEAYAEALRAAGVPVTSVREERLIHGFATMVGYGTAAPAAVRRFAAELQRGLV
ncbi:alpha/beta hydrolase fold domain-containing protein [Aeromicrobium sp. 636]|uniref:Alpha/beta hydrolase n=1 Tax=Aeromicrobium senzhongii TaxID=2663859 RepID=A0A8I0EXJ3_9ACTN|nr:MULTISPECIES: alpha/beta hydrolase [Aeromicrobium]MBC9227207.1 alpha/beta hydrolase [Aeromicrobium senzhongii]MCQ3999306.1 alpha/beta hydrolase fold domain-containing protein [Aeromicrobium sp. 636]